MRPKPITAIALLTTALSASLTGIATSPAAAKSCGSWGDGAYSVVALRGASCSTARQVLDAFDAGQRTLVPGADHMVDSQLPFRVRGYRCGGLQGRVVCVKGNWGSSSPPTNRPLVEAVLRVDR
jgi:hypothetical protein